MCRYAGQHPRIRSRFAPDGGCALSGLPFVGPAINYSPRWLKLPRLVAAKSPVALPLTGATALCDLVARTRRNAPPPGMSD
ncbi:hypothetical protein PIG67_07655 [Klebsiella aerogenes]|uniref:hypothetical protein n=1 Tax=Klebsiella aerogenes TaxID=548 RepID=UPI000AA07767|nr:hypothetical protein [Klebsiella aerogenes]HEJ0123078.1 hypothetical protein [Klebsiella aerogenes]